MTAAVLFVGAGCLKVKTEVEPIDINVTVKLEVQKELSDFFDDLDAQDASKEDAEGAAPRAPDAAPEEQT